MKHNKKGRATNPGGAFVQIFNGFMKEAAWFDLSMYARVLYLELKSHYNRSNNGQITLSIREAATSLNCSNNAMVRAFRDLRSHGFIKSRNKGYLGSDGNGIATAWELTELEYRGKPASRDYKKWRVEKNKTPSPQKVQGVPLKGTVSGEVSPQKVHVSPQKVQETPKNAPEVSPQKVHSKILPYTPEGVQPRSTQSPQGDSTEKLASRLGKDGWALLTSLSPESLESLVEKNEAGSLTDSDIAAAQFEASNAEGSVANV